MKTRIRKYLFRLFLRFAGNVVTAAEDWIHAQEVRLREEAAATVTPLPAAVPEEYQVKASAAREKKIRAARSLRGSGQAHRPRLVYHHGEFVRQA